MSDKVGASGSKARKVSPFQAGAIYFSANLMRNAFYQWMVIEKYITPAIGTRLHAFKCTLDFLPGTVGSGANVGIQLIQGLGGGLGQNRIGDLFFDKGSQSSMSNIARSATTLSNVRLARKENTYWVSRHDFAISNILRFPPSMDPIRALIGGLAGASASTRFRAKFQFTAARYRAAAPKLINPKIIMRCFGATGSWGFFFIAYQIADQNGVIDAINEMKGSQYADSGSYAEHWSSDG